MMRPTRPAPIVAAAAALIAGVVPTVHATAATMSVVPDDWVTLEDDTGLLTVAVPPEWSDTVTSPVDSDDGADQPRLTAATDVDAFVDGFEVPGMVVIAAPYDPDTPEVAANALTSGCRSAVDSRYDDGAFVGVMRHWTACGFGENQDAEVFIVAAAPVNRSMTLQLLVQITGPEQRDVVEGVLASFNLLHLPDPPATTTTTPGTSTTTSSTPGPTSAPGPTSTLASTSPTTVAPSTSGSPSTSATTSAPSTTTAGTPATSDEPQHLRDDSGALDIEVPASWTDITLGPVTRNDGTDQPNIAASPDLDAFLPTGEDQFLTPGVIYRALPYNADTEQELRNISRLGCVDGGITPYSDGLFAGHLWTFPSCGGTDTRQFIVAANPTDASFTAILVIRLTEPGNQELSTLLGSFTYNPSAVLNSPIASS